MPILIPEKSKTMLLVLVTPIFLTACAGERFDTRKSTSLVLPPVIQYEGKLLDQAADEVDAGTSPALIELVKDYKLTRDKLRIAHKSVEE